MSKLILVSAGHGANDPGAVNGKLKEAELATELRNLVAFYLARDEINHITDGEGRKNLPLRDAIQLAKRADIAIELHFNASVNKTAKGVEVLANPKHKALAQRLANAITSVTGSPLRGDDGYKPENSGQHARLGFIQAGGLIVEVEFISNDQAMDTYLSTKWLVAREIARVLKEEVSK